MNGVSKLVARQPVKSRPDCLHKPPSRVITIAGKMTIWHSGGRTFGNPKGPRTRW